MNAADLVTAEQVVVEVYVPIVFRPKGGAKRIISPGDVTVPVERAQSNDTMVKALARAFRWRRLLEEGKHATLSDLAMAEKINPSYVSRILRLTLLAPDIVTTVLNSNQQIALSITTAMQPFPVEWNAQRRSFGVAD